MKNPFRFMKTRPKYLDLWKKLEEVAEPIREYSTNEVVRLLYIRLTLTTEYWDNVRLLPSAKEEELYREMVSTATAYENYNGKLPSEYKKYIHLDSMPLSMYELYLFSDLPVPPNFVLNSTTREELLKEEGSVTWKIEHKEYILRNITEYINIYHTKNPIEVSTKEELEDVIFLNILGDKNSIASFKLKEESDASF